MNNDLEIRHFVEAARSCAMQMMSNATYIQQELPTLELPVDLRARIEAVCDSLIGTKHDVISELSELSELIETGASVEKLSERRERIVTWLGEPIREMHEMVQKLSAQCGADERCFSVFLLLVESATNILNAFNSVSQSSEAR
jgi:hypothetical protein